MKGDVDLGEALDLIAHMHKARREATPEQLGRMRAEILPMLHIWKQRGGSVEPIYRCVNTIMGWPLDERVGLAR